MTAVAATPDLAPEDATVQYSLAKTLGIWAAAALPMAITAGSSLRRWHPISKHLDGHHRPFRTKRVSAVPDAGARAGLGLGVGVESTTG